MAFGLGLAWGGPSAFESADSSWNVLFIHIILLRVLYFAVLVVYAVKNSKHSSSLLTRAAFIVITCIPYTIAFFVALFPVRNALWVLSIVLEQVSPIIEAILAAKLRWGQLAPVPMNVLRVRLGNLGTFIVTFMLVNLFQRKIGIPDSFGAINYTFMPYICALMSILIYFALQRISINSTMMTFRLKKRPPLVHQPETFNGALDENLQQQLRQNISSDSLNSPPPPPTPAATTKVGKSNKMYTASDVNLRLITYIWRWCHVPFHACISLTCVVLQIMLENMNVLDLYSSSAFTQSPPTSQVPFWSHVQTNLNGVINNIDTTVTNTSKVAAILAASYQSFLTNGNPLVGSSSSLIEDTSDSVGKWSPPIYFCAFLSASLLMSILVKKKQDGGVYRVGHCLTHVHFLERFSDFQPFWIDHMAAAYSGFGLHVVWPCLSLLLHLALPRPIH